MFFCQVCLCVKGGNIVACGSIEDIKNCPTSLTGQYLSGKKQIPIPKERREGNGEFLEIKNAHKNNLKNIDVKICFCYATYIK